MQPIIKSLNKPYPLDLSFKKRWLNCLWFSVFVFLFLILFQPFGLHRIVGEHIWVALGYAGVCFFVMAFLNIAVFASFPGFFAETNWTALKELFWVFVNVACIGLGNFLFSVAVGFIAFSIKNMFVFGGYTLAVGFFPIMAMVLYNQARLSKRYQDESRQINISLAVAKRETTALQEQLTLVSENGNDALSLASNDLLYIKAADNYVEVYFLEQEVVQKKLLRNTLKNVQMALNEEQFMRCHKSYIINLSQIESFFGNAQGYKLRIKHSNELVPVSRTCNHEIKNRLVKG